MTLLLSPQDLAQKLSLSVQTIYNRHSNGGSLPPCVKIGNRLRFRQTDVDEWISTLVEPTLPATLPSASVMNSSKRRPGRPTKAEQIAQRRLR